MFETMLCAMLTIFPDYLFRRYVQGKRIGREITLYSVWFELRWGIIGCVVLTLSLITTIFYFHPSTTSAVSLFRTVPILSERVGRVDEVYVDVRDDVRAGDPLFRLESSEQEAAAETARKRIAEIDSRAEVLRSNLEAAEGRVAQAESELKQIQDELDTKLELFDRGSQTVTEREIEQLQTALAGEQAALGTAIADRQGVQTELDVQLPAQKASAEAELAELEAELAKSVIYADVDGTLEQFTLRPGDLMNPMIRPAGVLVPAEAGRGAIIAGFGQIEAQVLKVGMIAEAACIAKPFTIIPLVVADVQEVIAAGQLRASEVLVEAQTIARPGTITVYLEPLYEGALDGLPPGSTCIANAYTSNHEALASPDIGPLQAAGLHAIDTVGLLHAMILRLQVLVMPVQQLVLGEGH